MFNFPISLSIQDKLIVVVGYGSVGKRKVSAFIAGGARVRVIDPAIDSAAIHAPLPEGVEFYKRAFTPLDIADAYLVAVAVGDPNVEDEVVTAANKIGIHVNVAGNPEKGDFALPALLRRDELQIAVSTNGSSPAVAVAVRDRIAERFGPEWGILLDITAKFRVDSLTESESSEYNRSVLSQLLEGDVLKLISGNDQDGLNALLDRIKQQ